jgi:hypothetical protein
MYKIEVKDFGYKLTFSGYIQENEMKNWVEESMKALSKAPVSFNVFVDIRNIMTLSEESKMHMLKGQRLFKAKGMVRSVVIIDNIIVKLQFKQIAQETGIYDWERYIDASAIEDWEKAGINWITKLIDPDKVT